MHLGQAAMVRTGANATVISHGRTLPLCIQAADELSEQHEMTFDVLDLRTLYPYDWPAIRKSAMKTGRVLIVNEDTEIANFGEHLLRRLVDELFYDLLARPRVLLGKHLPGIGLADVYEQNSVPQLATIKTAMREVALEEA